MFYLEQNFNFVINLLSVFTPTFPELRSEPKSESESEPCSVLINLGASIFFVLYLHSSK